MSAVFVVEKLTLSKADDRINRAAPSLPPYGGKFTRLIRKNWNSGRWKGGRIRLYDAFAVLSLGIENISILRHR